MSLFGIAWRTIRQRLLTSGLTALSLALGVALVVATLVIGNIVTQAFKSGSGLGYNMIVGAKGSPLQLVLNSVYLVSKPIENISWAFYEEFLPAASRPDGVAAGATNVVAATSSGSPPPPPLPFELAVLEALLSETVRQFERRHRQLRLLATGVEDDIGRTLRKAGGAGDVASSSELQRLLPELLL